MTVSLIKASPVPPRTEPQGTIWVCTDCMLTHANGEATQSPDCEPWALWADAPAGSVTMGDTGAEWESEGSFSWSDCDGCGSRLGGDRWVFTYWG